MKRGDARDTTGGLKLTSRSTLWMPRAAGRSRRCDSLPMSGAPVGGDPDFVVPRGKAAAVRAAPGARVFNVLPLDT